MGETESAVIRQGVAYWHSLRGSRRFPARVQITLRGLSRLARHAAIIRVIDGGADYEFRFVGHEPGAAVGLNLQGRRMSEPEVDFLMRSNLRQQQYDRVVRTGEPCLFKSRRGNDRAVHLPVGSEAAFLPLGESDDTVDHLLGFVVFSTGCRV